MNTSFPSRFHPIICDWFVEQYGTPTDIQEKAWVEIAGGGHVLCTAPTGCGKTLAAFLWSLNQLLSGVWETGCTRVLYVSPLKALNNDVRKNLLKPLEELQSLFREEGEAFPEIRVLTRSGDTPGSQRQRMLRRPPEILITTPESLNLLLTSEKGRGSLAGLKSVILDEIHAVAGSKRGVHLITAVERLTLLSGDFQRIGLSATVRPLQRAADFLGGYEMNGSGEDPVYKKRQVNILVSSLKKDYDVKVSSPESAKAGTALKSRWHWLASACLDRIRRNRATLIFANNRRFTEKLTRLINEAAREILAYSHHGSLSRELRLLVEQKLKKGELKAIVATSSLELGIDIGELDEVVLIGSPRTVSSAIQRIGRGGHRVMETSRAVFLTLFDKDVIDCAMFAGAVKDEAIEETHVPLCPLDLCAQIILSMTGTETWQADKLFHWFKTAYPFHGLSRGQFDGVVEMLCGRYSDSRIRELSPRLSYDRLDGSLRAKPGALWALYSSGGTIPDRGYYALRMAGTREQIGELDEEFVWERSVGDTFLFGAQVWGIQRIDSQSVEVISAKPSGAMAPFWKAGQSGRAFATTEKIGAFLESFENAPHRDAFQKELNERYCCDNDTAAFLMEFLARQRESLGCPLPHRHHLVMEHFEDKANQRDSKRVILHSFWGSRVNGPFSIALAAAWEQKHGYPLQTYYDDDCIMVSLPHELTPDDLSLLVQPENIERLLRNRLESTGIFGAHFRENAARALLLPKRSFKQRMPLWLNRLRAKKLLAAVMKYEDFPILTETWRTCLRDEFDLDSLKLVLEEMRQGIITVSEAYTSSPSLFASNLIWRQTNQYMYEDDTPLRQQPSRLGGNMLRDLVHSSELRPRLPAHLVREFTAKLQRTHPGYAPAGGRELLDWLKERLVIPEAEWQELLACVNRDHGLVAGEALSDIHSKLVMEKLAGANAGIVAALENLGRIRGLVLASTGSSMESGNAEGDFSTLLEEWLRYYGPVTPLFLTEVFGISGERLDTALRTLQENRGIVIDRLIDGNDAHQICDTRNLEMLLRIRARRARPQFKPLAIEQLPLFLAHVQGLVNPGENLTDLKQRFDSLLGYPVRAGLWETEILPARLSHYYTEWLDTLLNSSSLEWVGCGREKILFTFGAERELFSRPLKDQKKLHAIFPGHLGSYSFDDILVHSGKKPGELTEILWKFAWRGSVSNTHFEAVRKGIQTGFRPDLGPFSQTRGRAGRAQFNRWKKMRAQSGLWQWHPEAALQGDPLEAEEDNRDRIRQLLARYGLLCRELLVHETPILQWKNIFRSLRLMELSGEVLSGKFFNSIPGLQFISHKAFRLLSDGLDEEAVFWVNACDPASLCGVPLEDLKGKLPSRLPSNHVVYRGFHPVVISRRNGELLTVKAEMEKGELHSYLACFRNRVSRQYHPDKSVRVIKINGEAVERSSYREVLLESGFEREYRGLVMRRRIGTAG